MAPEQAGGKAREIGPARGVYALGAIGHLSHVRDELVRWMEEHDYHSIACRAA
jgi:hypothetical protein